MSSWSASGICIATERCLFLGPCWDTDFTFTVEHLWRFIKTTFKAGNYTVTHLFESELS